MFQRIIPLIKFFILLLIFFIIQKPIFMGYHAGIYSELNLKTIAAVIQAGLPMDITMACYFLVIPTILGFISIFWISKSLLTILKCYSLFISTIIALLFIIDLQLYSYWGFRLDTTPLFYFVSSPRSAMASITLPEYILGLIGIPSIIAILYFCITKAVLKPKYWLTTNSLKIKSTLLLCISLGLIFLGIRGGWTVSTMNLSRVYFSTDEKLNQAAINPIFSLMESSMKEQNFSKQFQYFSKEKANNLVDSLNHRVSDEIETRNLLKITQPNIYLVLLESFSVPLMETKVEGKTITPHLNAIADSSIYFTQFYANSFRTDRGLISILSGFPSQPNTSVMKYTRKTQKLPSISSTLKNAGYDLSYFYGGDINFTNLNAYLKGAGFEYIVSDKDFPIQQKLSKWGVHDEFVFDKAIEYLKVRRQEKPHFSIIQTSSSHEPFEVPIHQFESNKANAFAYTDKCLSNFIENLKTIGEWENSLIILIPDHQGAFPENLSNNSLDRYHIPLIWTGGAISKPDTIHTIGSQIDLAATLLAQLQLPHQDFNYSKNLLDSNAMHYGYFSFPEFAGLWTKEGGVILNLKSAQVQSIGEKEEPFLSQLKAYIQKVYLDMDAL